MTTALRIGHFESPMRAHFKHASASRSHTQNVIVELRDESGLCGYGEGCPREYVTGETQASAKAFLGAHGPEAMTALGSLRNLRHWVDEHEALIDATPAAICAFDLAALDLLGKRAGITLEQLPGLPPLSVPIAYTAVMADSSPGKARAMSLAYRIWGFSDFKIKVGGDVARNRARFRTLPRNAPECPGMPRNAPECPGMPRNCIANIRVCKCGGVLRSIKLAQEFQAAGMGITLGAQVGEASLLSRAALTLGKSLAPPPRAREGAYGRLLLKRDLTEPSLRFQIGGKLAPSRINLQARPGLGLDIIESAVSWS